MTVFAVFNEKRVENGLDLVVWTTLTINFIDKFGIDVKKRLFRQTEKSENSQTKYRTSKKATDLYGVCLEFETAPSLIGFQCIACDGLPIYSLQHISIR